jgi:hypothetical protein
MTVPFPHNHCGIWSAGPIDPAGDLEAMRARAEGELLRLGEDVDAALYLRRAMGGGVRLTRRDV